MELNPWLGYWDNSRDPPDNKWFCLNFNNIGFGDFRGLSLNRSRPQNGWRYMVEDFCANYVSFRTTSDRFGLPRDWEDSILFHPAVLIVDTVGERICNATQRIRVERMLNGN